MNGIVLDLYLTARVCMNVEISWEQFDAIRPHLCHVNWSPDFLGEEDWNVAQKYRIPYN